MNGQTQLSGFKILKIRLFWSCDFIHYVCCFSMLTLPIFIPPSLFTMLYHIRFERLDPHHLFDVGRRSKPSLNCAKWSATQGEFSLRRPHGHHGPFKNSISEAYQHILISTFYQVLERMEQSKQSTNTSAIIISLFFPQLYNVIPQATTKSWAALHQVGIMTEKIKKLEQLVRIKDSKIEVGRIQLPSLPYCSRLSRVIIPDDPIVPGKTVKQGGSPHHALGGCVQTWSLKDVDVKAKPWNKQRHMKLSQMKVSWCVMMFASILLCGMAREGEYDHMTRYGSGETVHKSRKLEFHWARSNNALDHVQRDLPQLDGKEHINETFPYNCARSTCPSKFDHISMVNSVNSVQLSSFGPPFRFLPPEHHTFMTLWHHMTSA